MNAADFDTQFNRLTAQFHLPKDSSRDTVALDWYQAVQGYDKGIVEYAVTTMLRSSQDTYWPPLGVLLDLCRGRAAGSVQPGKCPTCHGSSWMESAPFKSNGLIYENVMMRCPDCGIPQPIYQTHYRAGLTAIEYREWSEGPPADQMPEGLKAKPWKPGKREKHKAEMREMFDRLRRKLFPPTPEEEVA